MDLYARVLPYFNSCIHIRCESIRHPDGGELGRWEQVFLFNHIARGGSKPPAGRWKALHEFPNTVSKIKSLLEQVEKPLKAKPV